MASIFVDRQSGMPNRYKVTPETGEPYYVTLERDDEPIIHGTPLNANTFNNLVAPGADAWMELNANVGLRVWVGSQEEYEAYGSKLNNTLCIIEDDQTLEKLLPLSGGTLTGPLYSRFGIPMGEIKLVDSLSDFNAFLETGGYYFNYFAHQHSPNGGSINGFLDVIGNPSAGYAIQTFYGMGDSAEYAHSIYYRKCCANVWGEWECLNPRMNNGVEYRTTERYNGLPVYTMAVRVAIPASGNTNSVDIEGVARVVEISGCVYTTNATHYGEMWHPLSLVSVKMQNEYYQEQGATTHILHVEGNDEYAQDGGVAYITVKYTKD